MRMAAHRAMGLALVVALVAPLVVVSESEQVAASAPGDNIVVSGPAPAVPVTTPIVDADVTAVRGAAEALWVGATFSPAVSFVIADLPDDRLATALGTTITIDPTAAGRGWHTAVGDRKSVV